MSTLAALTLATPLFGFALTPPSGAPLYATPGGAPWGHGLWPIPVFTQLAGGGADADGDEGQAEPEDTMTGEGAHAGPGGVEETSAPARAPATEPVDVSTDVGDASAPAAEAQGEPSGGSDLAAQLRQRQEVAGVHQALGISTWGSMLGTLVLGFIQYHNLYGGFGGLEDTPCVRGEAVFGQDQCWGPPYPHLISAMLTTALYSSTFILSFLMPDPLDAASGDGELAENLRIHKALRWVHLAGMALQVVLGFASGMNWFGWERSNDFDAQRALASVHMGIGVATWVTLGVAGALMTF